MPTQVAAATESAHSPVVRVDRVSKSFPNSTSALDAVSLDVNRGEFLTLLGPSGCGKSTLLRLVARLLEPTAGTVNCRLDKVGFVFQEPTLMPWASVHANVRLPLELAGADRADADSKVEGALAAVGLHGFSGHRPRELSGGMRMRVSIARALVDQPDLLLMDEPFGALDEITRNRLDSDLISLWHALQQLTVIFVTHSIYEAVYLSTRVVVMSPRPGRIIGELAIAEPHPRDEGFRMSEGFSSHCRYLSGLLTRGLRDQS